MSRVIKELQSKQQELVNQRSGMKDQIEQIEKSLGQIGFALQTQEAIMKVQEEEDKAAADIAETSAEPSNN